jgi:DNA-binding NarL/FixJ family response regulator
MRILLAEDQPKVRHALRVLLEHQPGLEVVGEVADGAALLAQVKAARPDIVLLHWRLRGWSAADPSVSSGQDLLCGLREAYPGLAVIVLSGHPEVEEAAVAAGADAFVSKADPPEVLLDAIAGVKREEDTTTASAATLTDE